MSTRIRLQRHGKKGKPFFHIVVADHRAKRDGRFIEKLGTYNPNTNPATINLDFDRSLHWIQTGASPSDTARAILSYKGVLMKEHLLRGVTKGALTEDQAEAKFQAWMESKQSKIENKVSGLAKAKDDAEKARLAAEKEVSDARAAARASEAAAAEAEAAGEEAGEADTAEAATEEAPVEAAAEATAEETTTEEAPAEEAPAEEPASAEATADEEVKEEAPAEEAKAEEAPAEAAAEETTTEEAPAAEAKAEEPAADEAPAEEAKAEESASDEAPVEEAKAEESASAEAPADKDEKKEE